MRPLVFHSAAKAELDDAMTYYERCAQGLGLDLQNEVERASRRLQKNPEHSPPHKRSGFRKCFIKRFRFTIFFMELPTAIWIAAIAHQSRRPDYWRSRTLE